jgi:hypothetical protein
MKIWGGGLNKAPEFHKTLQKIELSGQLLDQERGSHLWDSRRGGRHGNISPCWESNSVTIIGLPVA